MLEAQIRPQFCSRRRKGAVFRAFMYAKYLYQTRFNSRRHVHTCLDSHWSILQKRRQMFLLILYFNFQTFQNFLEREDRHTVNQRPSLEGHDICHLDQFPVQNEDLRLKISPQKPVSTPWVLRYTRIR